MEYLANPFNHSVRSFSNDGICGILNLVSLNLFYYIIYVIGSKLEEIQKQEQEQEQKQVQEQEQESEQEKEIEQEDILDGDDIKDISEIPDMVFDNVFDDETVDVKVKKNLTSLLDINSLERHYILYYIFKKRGAFYDGVSNINTYAYYNSVANEWSNIYFADGNLTLKMNLDESLENDYQIVINDLICNCNVAHVRFLSWLYYSGIYDYLMYNQDIKTRVLNDMNTKKLLTGNLFLKYQLSLILIKMEYQANNASDLEQKQEQNNQSQIQNEVFDLGSDSDDLVEESAIDEEEANNSKNEINDVIEYNSENDEELNNRSISEDISDMNEMTFAGKLLTTVKNITIRTIISTWKIIKEEATELFHPVLG